MRGQLRAWGGGEGAGQGTGALGFYGAMSSLLSGCGILTGGPGSSPMAFATLSSQP